MPWTIPAPRIDGYELAPTDPAIRTDMEVGAKRTRRRTLARNDVLSVAWRFTDTDFKEFRDWFDTTAGGGSTWFDMPLAIGKIGLTEESAKFAEIYKAKLQPGMYWYVTAKLEVR